MKQRFKMQSNHENINDFSKNLKRSKSITRYPKHIPTYVVAFAMHETYDELMTAQQMNCKRSPQGSVHSITPTNSVKMLDTSTIEKSSYITDMSKDNDQTTAMTDAIQFPDIKIKSETEIVTVTNVMNSIKNIQPEVIFNSTHVKRFKDDRKFRKRNRKNKHVEKFKNLHLKWKHCKSINKKIELHYTKSKRTAVATDIVNKGLCNASNIINQSRTLKKVLAIENLLEEQPQSDGIGTDEFSSLSSSTTKKGILSHSSDNTLTRKWSAASSRINDYSSINSSVVQVSSENMIPYKTDVINVAVAMAFNKAKTNQELLQRQFMAMNEEIYLAKHDLTGTETVILPPITLTSKSPSYESSNLKNASDVVNLIKDSSSNTTLISNYKKSRMAMSIDEDTFVIARTSSDFNKSSFNSNLTLTNSGTQSDDTIYGKECFMERNDYNNKQIFDTVINLGMFPEENPSTSKFNENSVIITNEHKTYVKKDNSAIINEQGDLSKNIFKKNFDVEKNLGVHKLITLPDEAIIREKLKENNVAHRKTENEYQNTHPSTLSDLWDRLIVMLERALKRIEETLPDRIVEEIKKILDFDEYKNFVLKVMSEKTVTSNAGKQNMLSKGVSVDLLKIETDENLQCDLIQNQVIDRLMTKYYPEGLTKTYSPKFSHKLITKIFKDYFEDLLPGVESDIEKEDLTASGVELEFAPDAERFNRLKILLTAPIKFVKQNAFVLTSVPTFLLILLCTYGLIIFIMKPL